MSKFNEILMWGLIFIGVSFVFYLVESIILSCVHFSLRGFNIMEWAPFSRGIHLVLSVIIGLPISKGLSEGIRAVWLERVVEVVVTVLWAPIAIYLVLSVLISYSTLSLGGFNISNWDEVGHATCFMYSVVVVYYEVGFMLHRNRANRVN